MNPKHRDRAVDHARATLRDRLDDALVYHSLFHTEGEVVPAVRLLAKGEGLDADATDLVVVAAWYHDIGFIVGAEGHERVGATMAAEVLPGFGLSRAEVDVVCDLVLATHVPQRPATHLQEILCDADLCSLGQPSYASRSEDLRRERAATTGAEVTDAQWARSQATFLASHRYFTDTARRLWGAEKSQNMMDLEVA